MKKFLLLKFIIILMTKDIFTYSFHLHNFKYNLESSNEGLEPIDSDDMTRNSHVTDKDTTTKNIDSIIAKFGSEFERLKDLMVDYIKANGKRPMTHEFNKNSKKFIDYLNFSLANVQPGDMRNQIEDVVEEMNAMLKEIHGKFPNGGENEEFLNFFDAESEIMNSLQEVFEPFQEPMNSWINGQNQAIDQNIQQNILSNYVQNFIDQIYKNFKIDVTPNLINFEEIISNLNLAINQFFSPLTTDQNLGNFILKAFSNLQNNPTVNLQQILLFLKSATNGNSFKLPKISCIHQFFPVLGLIINEYLKALNLLIQDHLLKSRSPFTVVLLRKPKLESEISTTNISQNSTETRTSVDANEDLKSSIDAGTSPQSSLETVKAIENPTELNIDTNSTETNSKGPEKASEHLRKLEEITMNLRMENFTENDIVKVANYKKEVIGLLNHFRETENYEKAEDLYNELQSLTKTLEMFKRAVSVVNSKNTVENLQDIEKLILKLNVIQKFYVNKNQFLQLRAKELKQQLKMIVDQFNSKHPDIPSELIKINEAYSIPENNNLKFLNEASKNLISIIYAVKTINSTNFANKLFNEVQNLIQKIYQTQLELNKIETQIKIPTNDTELVKLNEYKQRLTELRTQPEPSIHKKAIELDESIEKVIKEYQIKNH